MSAWERGWCPYGSLSAVLREQLLSVEPSVDGALKYRPCQITFRDGRLLDRVYVQEAGSYARVWGVWPENDNGKRSVHIEDVARIEESPTRLPVYLANKLYAAGESGMGYCLFTLDLEDERQFVCLTGNAVDFVELPPDVRPAVIRDVLPHVGRDHVLQGNYLEGAPCYWCLYSERPTTHKA